jgi:uncharacterized RDD family membrane protein YckC
MEQQSQTEVAPVAPSAPAPVVSAAPTSDVDTVAGKPVATGGRRILARIVDGLLIYPTLIIGYLIWTLVCWNQGTTPGKKLLGMYVVDQDTGETLGFGRMFMRGFVFKGMGSMISFGIIPLISLFGVLGANHQALWDKWANCKVVETKQ